MSSTSQGTVLAGRYRLERRIQTDPDGALWRARDATLDRLVSVRVLRPGHPFAADVADAARRAALVDDPRLVRVLDVGSDSNVGFVVMENVNGETLAAIVERAPLTGPAIRRIVGEIAEGLSGAAGRGLHHLRLTPRSVMVRADGSVKLLGTAVEAAAAGLEPDHAASANRVDAVGLVALIYSGLTGRWPLGDAGFPPAPYGGTGPVAPAELVQGVPNDLDTLCAVTLSRHNDGPRSPGEVARQLAPWPAASDVAAAIANAPVRVPARPPRKSETARPVTPSGRRDPTTPASLFAPITPAPPDALRDPRRGAAARTGPREPGAPGNRPAGARPAADAGAAPAGSPPVTPSAFRPAKTRTLGPADTTEAAVAQVTAPHITPAGQGSSPGTSPGIDPRISPGPAPAPSTGTTQAAPASQSQATSRPSRRTPANGIPAGTKRGSRRPTDTGELLLPWSGTWTPVTQNTGATEATGPFPILIPAEHPPNRQSRLVLVAVAAIVVTVLVLAVFSLRDFGRGRGDNPRSSAVAPVTATSVPSNSGTSPASTNAPTQAPATTTPAVTTAAAPKPVIEKIRAIDPQGNDGDENSADSPKAVDGSGSTEWKSDTYNSASFGGLKKGLGLAIRLKDAAVIRTVEMDVKGSGGSIELRGGPSWDYSASKLLASSAISGETVTLTSASKATFRYVILWFTKLPTSGGNHRAEVTEVRVT